MFRLTSNINIADRWRFKGMVSVEVVSSWDQLTDTATLTVPKKINWQGEPLVFSNNPILKKGNPLSIEMGLNYRNAEWFKGYITAIHAGKEVTVDCQDAMFLLKKGTFTKAYEKAKLSQILRDMMPASVPYEVVADYDFGQLRISNATPAQVLEQLRQDYFVRSFFRDGKLYAGLAVVPKLQQTHRLKWVIDNNLEYINKDEVKILIKGVIMDAKNKKETIEVGDKDGEVRTFHQYNISKTEMKRLCEQELERLKYSGFRGSFTTFIEPYINHGDVVYLPELYDVDTEGGYLVKKVTRSFDGTKARQNVELERKILTD
ncbi:MAG: hypothetical protein JNL70_00265 [Saprospiraceae bacterium]|nr:hypothetical protein [Saprospiraceae bacterium]